MLMFLIGFSVATFGTLIGVGGGFLLVPILLFMHPGASSTWVASVSMWGVALNATSGTIAYLRKGTVHIMAAMVFIVASLPGSYSGVYLEHYVSRRMFEMIFGGALLIYAFILVTKELKTFGHSKITPKSKLSPQFYVKGSFISYFVGFMASFLGIGGGVIHVPLLSRVLGFPVHLATGTSHMILAVTAWFTVMVHLQQGHINLGEPILWQIGSGAILGAQLGAHLSGRVSGTLIIKILGGALALVGLSLLLRG